MFAPVQVYWPVSATEERMKRLLALHVFAASLILAACGTSAVVDDQGKRSDEPIVEQLSSQEGAGVITTTPDGVVAPIPEGEFVDHSYQGDAKEGASGNANILACHVDLLFCRDSRFGNLPSGCTNGGCTISQAHNAASSLCRSVCGNIDCSAIAWPPGCL